MTSTPSMMQLASTNPTGFSTGPQCRSQSGHAECRRPSRGRQQRCAQGQYREASRTSSARFGSRGSSVGARSRSGTRCRRPSSEVELRAGRAPPAKDVFLEPSIVNDCASGFVCDLIDDAVDDFADDLVHDVDDVIPAKQVHAQLVLNAGEPAITEEVEEDEEICFSARLLTEEAAEEALRVTVPSSPSLSLQMNASSQGSEAGSVAKETAGTAKQLQLQLSASDQETDETDSLDGYEEVYSLASDNHVESQETDDELEALAYCKMALNLAKNAVSKGCSEMTEEVVQADEGDRTFEDDEEEPVDIEAAKREARKALRSALLDEESSDEEQEDAKQEQQKAKTNAISALKKALLPAQKQETIVDEEEVDEVGDCVDNLAFGYTSNILDGAFDQASATWDKSEEESEEEDDEEDTEALRHEALSTLSKAVANGNLLAALNKVRQEKQQETLRAQARGTMVEGLRNGQFEAQLEKIAQERKEKKLEELREKAQKTMLEAAMNGKFEAFLENRAKVKQEEDGVEQLRMTARQTFLEAAHNGKLEEVMAKRAEAKKAARMEDLKAMARNSFLQAAGKGKLDEALAKQVEAKKEKTDDLKTVARNILLQASTNGKFDEVLAKRAEAKKDAAQLEDLRMTARNTLLQASSSGKLQEVLAQRAEAKKAAQMEDLRAMARNTLLQASNSGKLNEVLVKRAQAKQQATQLEDLRVMARDTLLQASSTGKLEEVLARRKEAKQQAELEDVRAMARDTLLKAASSGKLQQIVAKRAEEKKAVKLDELKTKARDSLLKVARDRGLAPVPQPEEPTMETLKQKARETLLKAARAAQSEEQDSSLQLAKKENHMKARSLAAKAKDTLEKAAMDGRLLPALKAAGKASEMKQLQMQLRVTLLEAAKDGRLAPALQKVAAKGQKQEEVEEQRPVQGIDMEALKKKAQDTLAKAAMAGKFEGALSHLMQPTASVSEATSEAPVESLETLRLQVRETLLKGAKTGELSQAFATVRQENNVQDLQSKFRDVFKQGAMSGKLDEAFRQVREAKQPAPVSKTETEMPKATPPAKSEAEKKDEGLMAKLRAVFSKGMKTGEVSKAVAAAKEEENFEALRGKIKNTLQQGLSTGKLGEALRDAVEQDQRKAEKKAEDARMEEMKREVREVFKQGALSGKLDAAIRQVKEAKHVATLAKAEAEKPKVEEKMEDDLMAKLRTTLAKAAKTGDLSKAFATVRKTENDEALRSKVKNTLQQGLSSGKLSDALRKATKQEDLGADAHMEDLRKMARDTLKKGLEMGKLSDAMQEIMAKRNEVPAPAAAIAEIAPIAEAAPLPFKPQTQRESSRPMRRSSSKGAIEKKAAITAPEISLCSPTATASKTEELATPGTARSSLQSSRSRRRIIGGVVRAPSMQLDFEESMRSATPKETKRHAKSQRKSAKEVPEAIRMDLSESGGEESSAWGRGSSLTRGYDTLGAQFFNLEDSPSAASASKTMFRNHKLEAALEAQDIRRGATPTSKTRAKLQRATSMSAMAMDLGEGDASARGAVPSASHLSAAYRFSPAPLSLEKKMRPSASLGSLQTPKMKVSGGLLPTLAADKKSAESIAWTMQMSKTTSKWCNTGLRGSSSMVF